MLSFLLDFLFPPHCVQCKSLGSYLCQNCRFQLSYYQQPIDVDLDKPSLDQLFVCCTYTKAARSLVKTLKYKAAYKLTETITQLMIEHIPFPNEIEYFTAVPLHPRRQHQRGFNQAELIGKQLSTWLQIPYQELIVRTKATSPQAELNRQERLTHLQDAFTIKSSIPLKNKNVAIVDDVATTGTTLNEVAKVLKKAGAMKVYGVVFCHGK